jgi:DNA-binding SARP family transcriptional activator
MAALLLEANRVLSTDRLVSILWGTRPPSTAKEQVQNVVSALRRSIERRPGFAGTVVTRSPGYMVVVDADQLDSAVFEERALQAQAAAASGEPRNAVGMYRSALSLWRGPALSGLRSGVVQAAATRLNEHRLSVLEDYVDLQLQLGEHRSLIGDLQALALEHPFRERLRAQLMLALHRTGRTAEALEVYRSTRRTLIDELGLEPGDDLRRLEQQILANDPALPPSGGPLALRSEPSRGATPKQLPADLTDIIGRDAEVARIDAVLDPAHREGTTAPAICVVTGPPGVGKSAVAVHAATRLVDGYPDGQLYACVGGDDRESASPVDVLRRFLSALGHPDASAIRSQEECEAAYRTLTATSRLLIVLDNALDEAQVRPLLPAGPRCGILVTSRSWLTDLPGAGVVKLDTLSDGAAIAMLAATAGPDRVAAAPALAHRIVEQCGRLPLAVRIAGARLAAKPHWDLAVLARRMRDETTRLSELRYGTLDVCRTLALSRSSLGPAAGILFRRLALLAGTDFPVWTAGALADVSSAEAEELLERLVDAWLVRAHGPDSLGQLRFELPELPGLYAAECLREEDSRQAGRPAALRRLREGCHYLVCLAERHDRVGSAARVSEDTTTWRPPPAVIEAVVAKPAEWLDIERPRLLARLGRPDGWSPAT